MARPPVPEGLRERQAGQQLALSALPYTLAAMVEMVPIAQAAAVVRLGLTELVPPAARVRPATLAVAVVAVVVAAAPAARQWMPMVVRAGQITSVAAAALVVPLAVKPAAPVLLAAAVAAGMREAQTAAAMAEMG